MKMNIPFMRLDRQFADNAEAYMDAVRAVFTHGRVLQGPEVAKLEERMAAFFGLSHAAAVGSCTDALILALKACGLKPGAKVAVTSLSFVASASAIAQAGGVPVFVDVEPEYFCTSENKLLELVKSRKVDAVVAVHLYGQMMELGEVYAETEKYGVIVIEDAAQALGASRHGKAPGHCSHATCVSFDPTKVIGAQGSGGMVLTGDEEVAARVKRLRYHGHAGGRVYAEIGHNSQLPTVQAALISAKMDHELAWRERRQQIAARYGEAAEATPGVTPPKVREGNEHIFHKYVLSVDENRDGLAEHLRAHGVSPAIHYTRPLHTQPCFEGKCETASEMSTVNDLVGKVLSLPIYPELTDDEVEHICTTLRSWK